MSLESASLSRFGTAASESIRYVGIPARIARRGQSFVPLLADLVHQNRRLRIGYEQRPDIHQAFFSLALIKICASALFAGFC
jgi:hypothetical protein